MANLKTLTENIRVETSDDSELRESMRQWGWISEFPALVDEHGVTLVGNRRTQIARELGIEPVIKRLTFGAGDVADAERIKLALASNIGGAPFTPKDRKRIAEYLYGKREWTMQRIAEALNVTTRTISTDLGGFEVTSKPSRPKGGRPKGSGRKGKRGQETPKQDQARGIVRDKLERNEPISPHKLQEEHGISHVTFDMAITAELGRQEPLAEIAARLGLASITVDEIVDKIVDPALLPPSAQKKIATAMASLRRKLEREFSYRLDEGVKEYVEGVWTSHHQERVDRADRILAAADGVMSRETFRRILACLHPDNSSSVQRREEAFRIFGALEDVLCAPEKPLRKLGLPTAEQMRAMVAERRAKQAAAARRRARV